jgi:DNA-binding IscR family transcriptional regulator
MSHRVNWTKNLVGWAGQNGSNEQKATLQKPAREIVIATAITLLPPPTIVVRCLSRNKQACKSSSIILLYRVFADLAYRLIAWLDTLFKDW